MTTETKVYSIGLKGSSHNYALEQLHADQFHGVHCLKGIARSSNGAATEGKRVYIPVVEITTITEYDSWDHYLGAAKSTNGKAPPAASKKTTRRAKAKKK